jgi:hypothetical protein
VQSGSRVVVVVDGRVVVERMKGMILSMTIVSSVLRSGSVKVA